MAASGFSCCGACGEHAPQCEVVQRSRCVYETKDAEKKTVLLAAVCGFTFRFRLRSGAELVVFCGL